MAEMLEMKIQEINDWMLEIQPKLHRLLTVLDKVSYTIQVWQPRLRPDKEKRGPSVEVRG